MLVKNDLTFLTPYSQSIIVFNVLGKQQLISITAEPHRTYETCFLHYHNSNQTVDLMQQP